MVRSYLRQSLRDKLAKGHLKLFIGAKLVNLILTLCQYPRSCDTCIFDCQIQSIIKLERGLLMNQISSETAELINQNQTLIEIELPSSTF